MLFNIPLMANWYKSGEHRQSRQRFLRGNIWQDNPRKDQSISFRNQYQSTYLETGDRIKFNSNPIVYVDSHTKFGSLSPGQSWLLQDSRPSSKDILRHIESSHASYLVGPQFRLVLIAHDFLF